MSKERTTVVRRVRDGTLVRVMPGGGTEPYQSRTDWERVRAMTDEEVEAAARADPDAQPITPERESRLREIPRVRTLRRALHLTQEEFAARYCIPLGTLRDWEQGRKAPDQAARAYLTAIAHDPDGVARAFAK